MDGPSVNWSFYDKLGKEMKDECGMGLLNIGSCGLHVIHGALQTGDHQLTSISCRIDDSSRGRRDAS